MTKVLNWQKSDDVRDIVHLGVQALAERHIIAVPTCTSYVGAVMATDSQAVSALAAINLSQRKMAQADRDEIPPASLVLREANEVLDFCPVACPTAMRLAQRLWPGPTQLMVPGNDIDSLIRRLPPQAVELVSNSAGFVRLCRPAHPSIQEIARLSAGPLIALPLDNFRETGPAVSADSVSNPSLAVLVDAGNTKYQGIPTVLRVSDNTCRIVRNGITPLNELQSLSRMFILFVCTGNTCRSPMAEKLLESKLSVNQHDQPRALLGSFGRGFVPIFVMSAGIAAGGGPASPQAIAALDELGLDLSEHQSCVVTDKEIDSADLILAMTRSHFQAIISRWPTAAKKANLLHPDGEDVSDPFGGPVSMYRDSAQKISSYLDVWIERFSSMPLPKWLED